MWRISLVEWGFHVSGLILSGMFLDSRQTFNRLRLGSIIQDSAEDWAQEAAIMGRIYRNGLFNIAACNGTNSHQGIFTERNPDMGQPLVVDQKYSDQAVEITVLPD